jgi:hypothetical protein
MGKGQYAQAGFGHFILRGEQARLRCGIQRCDPGVELDRVAGREHSLQRALAVEHASLRRPTQHRHALADRQARLSRKFIRREEPTAQPQALH